MSLILSIDSSATLACVGLYSENAILGERALAWRSASAAKERAEQLWSLVDETLESIQALPAALSLVCVATGPGSFTGLRTGVATAQGMSLALGIPLTGVSLLFAEALSRAEKNSAVCVFLPASPNDHYQAGFLFGDSREVLKCTPLAVVPTGSKDAAVEQLRREYSRPVLCMEGILQGDDSTRKICIASLESIHGSAIDEAGHRVRAMPGQPVPLIYGKSARAKTVAQRQIEGGRAGKE